METIRNIRNSGINVWAVGILDLGERPEDHVGLIYAVATMP